MANKPTMLKRGGAWARVMIFISLYIMLLESLTEWVIVVYLYAIKQVDSKMTPSLVLSLIASFFTVPFVALHSLAAWQYNRVAGFGNQKVILHTSCTYILRVTVALWLAASVAGLVVASQQASCLPDSAGSSFWNTGVSCTLHRTVVIVTVVSFVTVCIFFCSRELCDRPYDISLLGVYKQPQVNRDGSIFSNTSSSDSENILKNDVLCLCRRPDSTPGPYLSSMDSAFVEKPTCEPSIKRPRPIHPRPLLTLDTNPGTELALSPSETLVPDSYPVSRSSTLLATPTSSQPQIPPPVAELPAPDDPSTSSKSSHKRAKSSLSSLKRFIPKAHPISSPLSADPQIRELSEPSPRRDFEKQSAKAPSASKANSPAQPASGLQATSASTLVQLSDNRRRSMTSSSADAPEVISSVPNARPHTQPQANSVSIHHPHHPNYLPYPQPQPRMPPTPSPKHHATKRRQSTNIHHFDPSASIPRHTQSQHNPHHYSRRRVEPSRNLSYSHRLRRDDVEILYPSTRRPRSSTYGTGLSSGRLDSIKEVTRGSLDESSYRGADRTSFVGI